eukprot:7599040-Pyramimonas_sp.AAC.1
MVYIRMPMSGSSTSVWMVSEKAAPSFSQENFSSSGAAIRSANELSNLALAVLMASPKPFTLASPSCVGAFGIQDS